jgi:hypothetical protein
MKSNQYSLERMGVMIVVVHFLVNVVHAAAHMRLHIDMNLWQTVYILVVIIVLPLASGYLLWRRARRGFLLLLCSMLGALIFGGYYHFIASGADNVGSLGSHFWARPFQVTAVLLALTEAAGVGTGVVGVLKSRVGSEQ